jgi:hypothetical protein
MATTTYHATAIPLSKWARDKINKIARNFIWAGDDADHASRGHALVNWKTVCRPKVLGGLGMTDLERFGRALRLRWPWLQWTDPLRTWGGSKLPCNEADMDLFRAATHITIGNGESTSFWSDPWTHRGPIRLWAPDLYKVASRKGRSVAKELHNDNWIRSIARLSTPVQLDQYLQVWDVIAHTQLSPTVADSITWKLNTDGVYSASSAYHMQFLGSFPRFDAKKIWSAHAEPKCKLFAWLALHRKLLTADMLAIRGWPHDPVCPLCLSAMETADHLCKDCPFTSAIWTRIQQDYSVHPVQHGQTFSSTNAWWDEIIDGKSAENKRRLSGRLLYVLWNAWKERNRRIFTGRRLTFLEVALLAREDIAQRELAFAGNRQTIPADPD